MEKLIKFIVETITESKAKIVQEEKEGETIFTIRLPEEKIGQVIGRGGQVIKAIKTLLRVQAEHQKNPLRWRLEVEPRLS